MEVTQHGRRPTSRDVARLAGVSRTTVSYVINGTAAAHIPEETRARVHAAIVQLDYHPHEAARNLRSQASRVIASAMPEATNPHHQETAAGLETYLKRQGYSLLRAITNFDPDEERRCLQWLKQQRVDALILSASPGTTIYDEIRALRGQGYCITSLGGYADSVDSVAVEDLSGERQAIEHLAALGHRRIGYIYGVADQELFSFRLDNCLAIQREHGLPVVEEWIKRCGPTQDEGYHATQTLLDVGKGTDRPTALVVVNDLLASAALSALYSAGLRVPDEMSVVSFDNTPLAAYAVPPLSSVDSEDRLMGEHAARLTLERLADPQRPLVHLRTRARLVVRASSGAPPTS